MKTISIKCNTKGSIIIDNCIKLKGVHIVLVDDNNIPVARYEFSGDKVSNLTVISYETNNVGVHFYSVYCDLQPTMSYECCSSN